MKKIVSWAVLIPLGCTINLRFSKSVPAFIIEIFEIVPTNIQKKSKIRNIPKVDKRFKKKVSMIFARLLLEITK